METNINPRERAALKAAIEDFELRRCEVSDSADLIITARRIHRQDEMIVADVVEHRAGGVVIEKKGLKFPLSELTR